MVKLPAGCFLYRAWESLVIGMIGAAIASVSSILFDKIRIDDPVGASAVHGACGFWGVIAVGLFADNPIPLETTNGRSGLFKGGGWYLLGVQTLTGVCLMAWGVFVTMLLLWLIDRVLPIRMDPYEELLGADLTEHRIRHGQVGVSRAVSALRPFHRTKSIEEVGGIGMNTGHNLIVDKLQEAKRRKEASPSGTLQAFSNQAFVEEGSEKTFRNDGLLNKRAGNPQNELHRALTSMAREINGAKQKRGTGRWPRRNETSGVARLTPETIKGRRFKELSAAELQELGEMNASQDRFRYRYTEDDYADDVRRSDTPSVNMRWID
ncbi:unnamed protein product, partial [Iphiclides podalirius]